jgi:hypothetical protein
VELDDLQYLFRNDGDLVAMMEFGRDGLTDAEYLWEPVEGAWSVRVRYRYDLVAAEHEASSGRRRTGGSLTAIGVSTSNIRIQCRPRSRPSLGA